MKLPSIKPSQEWCCSNGCGTCKPVERDYVYHRITDEYDNIIEEHSEKVWVSNCCGADLELWDNDKEGLVKFEMKD